MPSRWKRSKREDAYFDTLAPEYDGWVDACFRECYKLLGKKIQDSVRQKDVVLDVGTGTGYFALLAGSYAHKVVAVDISPSMIREAKKKADKDKLDNIMFSVADAYSLPFKSGLFDVVTCWNAFIGMNDPARALTEIKRVLKKDGKILVNVPCEGEWSIGEKLYYHMKLAVKLPVDLNSLMARLSCERKVHKFTKQEFLSLIEDCGFNILVQEEIWKEPVFIFALAEKARLG